VIHIAVDARFAVLDERGIGRYTRALLARFVVTPGVRITLVAPGLLAPRRRIAEAGNVAPAAVEGRIPVGARVVWGPSNGTDLETALPYVTTVHDIVPFTYPSADARVRDRERAPLLRTATLARRIVADSGFMAEQIARQLGVRRERIAIVPLGVDASFGPAGPRYGLPDGRPYVLHVGAHDARKNVGTLIAGWQAAFPQGDVALVFTRAPADLPAHAVVVSAATDAELAALYRGAAAVAVPSLDEGFGLPLLEALACAAPVVASRAAALPEVGGNAVVWVDEPRAASAWSAHLDRLVREREHAAAFAARGPAQAAPFTWDRCAARTLDVLVAAVGST
jgi:glycosyltransferase involved in cell wall biosynthesis